MDKITLNYFIVRGSLTRARGENIKLLLEDAGLEHEYIRSKFSENWPERKAELKKRGNYRGILPTIEIGDKMFCGTVPILRYISAKLGKYNGADAEENQYIDSVVDVTEDWFQSMKKAFFSGEDGLKVHQENELPNWFSILENYYSDFNEGPYLLGDRITYVDMMVYHMTDDEGYTKKLDGYPNLQKFITAFEERPNIKKYLASLAAQA